MKKGAAGPLRGIIKFIISIGIPAFLLYYWVFDKRMEVGEMIKEYFLIIQMLLGAAVGATLIRSASGLKSPSLLLLAETLLGAFVGGWLCRVVFGLIAKIVFKLGVVIAAIVCAALILASFAVGASTILHLHEEKVQRAEDIIHKSQNTNVSEDLRGFRNADGRNALNEAKRRIGHGIK